ncbi:MAG: Fic family protein [Thermoplasmata archaeon]|nr:MAG: Fic family protein [Thermoplasmata archaeon]
MAMFRPRYTITDAMNSSLLEIERARGFLDAANLKEEWLEGRQVDAMVLEAHHSTHIEGTRITLPQAEAILAGEDVVGVDRDDRQELLNYREAMDFVSDYLGELSDITEDLIRDIHGILVKEVRGGSLEPGRYRTVQNYVGNMETGEVIYTPPPPEEVPERMGQLVKWLNRDKGMSPVLVAGVVQHAFVDIHPFLDGNGRTARVLCTLVLYQNGYDFQRLFSLSQFYDIARQDYYDAIQRVREEDGDLTGWLEYFCEGLAGQLMGVKTIGGAVVRRDTLMERAEDLRFNERQRKVLLHVIDRDGASVDDVVKRFDLVRRTVQRDLAMMVDEGLLVEVASSKTDPTKLYRPL